jgi:hypothetical protein
MEMAAWARAFEKTESRRIGNTVLSDGTEISTVWLGLDHGSPNGPPLIFETMVFRSNRDGDLDCERYATEEGARAGHEAMVAKWMATVEHRNQ